MGASPCLSQHQPWHLGQAGGGADPPGGLQGPGMGTCGYVGPWQSEGASLQLASQKKPSPSPLSSQARPVPGAGGAALLSKQLLGVATLAPLALSRSSTILSPTGTWSRPLTSPWEEPS